MAPNYLFPDGGGADPPRLDRLAAIAGKLLDRPHIPLDDPVVDIGNAEIARVIDIVCRCLPLIIAVGLPRTGNLDIQLFD